MSPRYRAVVAAAVIAAAGAAVAQPRGVVIVHAAGSLRAAMTELAKAFKSRQGTRVKLNFGASGLLKDRLLAGEASQIVASANMKHPQALIAVGVGLQLDPFARNALCALASPAFTLRGQSLLQRLLDADVRVGISTPKADPAGDCAFRTFELIESTGASAPGSAASLKTRALQLTGGPNSPAPPGDRSVRGVMAAQGQADIFITYGMALVRAEVPAAQAFMRFVLGPQGRDLLAAHAFTAP